ncbi:MAG TPA: shikimate kinase [Bacillota bacterium]|nr:shikimate kinase [Bacillota bacterium]
MKTIYLIGFMGCGKTTIGESLSESTGKTLVDIDEYIVEKYQSSIPDIFANKGEETFRAYESEALQTETHGGIISTGGGIVQREENREFLKNNGIVVYLSLPFHTIVERLKKDSNRPLWDTNNENQMEKLYKSRLWMYETCADITINVDQKSVEEITEEITTLL